MSRRIFLTHATAAMALTVVGHTRAGIAAENQTSQFPHEAKPEQIARFVQSVFNFQYLTQEKEARRAWHKAGTAAREFRAANIGLYALVECYAADQSFAPVTLIPETWTLQEASSWIFQPYYLLRTDEDFMAPLNHLGLEVMALDPLSTNCGLFPA